jgi:hypothetical protein
VLCWEGTRSDVASEEQVQVKASPRAGWGGVGGNDWEGTGCGVFSERNASADALGLPPNVAEVFFFFFSFDGTGVCTEDFQVLYRLSQASSLFCSGYFGDGGSQTACCGWSRTVILILASSS